MTISSIVSRLANNFVSRLALLFSKTVHLNFWNKLLTKNNVTQDTSYNLAPLVGILIGFIVAIVAILGRLIFTYRVTATIIAFGCYLFFGFANALYEFGFITSLTKGSDTTKTSLNTFSAIVIALVAILWCTCVTCMRPARLFLSLMSAICISRFASCLVVYMANLPSKSDGEEKQTNSFDRVDLVVALLCTVPWLILSLEKAVVSMLFATVSAIVITKYVNGHSSNITTEKISGAAIVASEIFSLLIWLI